VRQESSPESKEELSRKLNVALGQLSESNMKHDRLKSKHTQKLRQYSELNMNYGKACHDIAVLKAEAKMLKDILKKNGIEVKITQELRDAVCSIKVPGRIHRSKTKRNQESKERQKGRHTTRCKKKSTLEKEGQDSAWASGSRGGCAIECMSKRRFIAFYN